MLIFNFVFVVPRQVNWHDLAFFDVGLYENLRTTVYSYEKENAEFDLTFAINQSAEEGSGEVRIR